MELRQFLKLTQSIIEQTSAPYALIGAFGMSVHGYQRATNDIDFLVHGSFRAKVLDNFLKNGFEIFHASDEVIQLSKDRPVDLLFANRPLSQKMLTRDNLPLLEGVPCLYVEDFIGLKIQAYQNSPKRKLRDQADIQSLAEVNPNMSWSIVKEYADLFGCWDEIRAIKELVDDK